MNPFGVGLAALALAGPVDLPGRGAVPPSTEELTLDLVGPADAMLGDQVHLQARVTGAVKSWKWSVFPDVDGLVMLDGGRAAAFSNRAPGRYAIFVSVADSWGHVAHDVLEFELLTAGPAVPAPQVVAAQAIEKPSLDSLVVEWAGSVNTNTAKVEAGILAGSFTSAANRIATGNMARDADPLSEVERQARIALGPRPMLAWETFFVRVRRDLVERIRSGELASQESFAAAFATIAAGLQSLGEDPSST